MAQMLGSSRACRRCGVSVRERWDISAKVREWPAGAVILELIFSGDTQMCSGKRRYLSLKILKELRGQKPQ